MNEFKVYKLPLLAYRGTIPESIQIVFFFKFIFTFKRMVFLYDFHTKNNVHLRSDYKNKLI